LPHHKSLQKKNDWYLAALLFAFKDFLGSFFKCKSEFLFSLFLLILATKKAWKIILENVFPSNKDASQQKIPPKSNLDIQKVKDLLD